MVNLDTIIHQLAGNAQAMRALALNLSAEQAQWKPGPETWSMAEVMEHIYNEERVDFRKHLGEMLSVPPQPWSAYRREELIPVKDCHAALEGFLREREESIAWLRGLVSPDWEAAQPAPWGAMHAGDVLVSWVEHDLLHLRQMVEVLYAWNAREAAPFVVQYAGDW